MVSIIVINHNQKELITSCVNSIKERITYPYEIIIVNNSGEDLSHLKEQAVILPSANLGFSHANNLGVKHSKGEYLLFLNADTVIRNDFMERLITDVKDMDFGALGLKMYNEDGTFQLSFWEENTFKNERQNKKAEKKFKARDTEYISDVEKMHSSLTGVDWVSGAAMVIKRDRFNAVTGFDEDFFLFYEDADICKRLNEAGNKIYFYPHSDIIHYKGENVNPEFSSSTYFYSKQSQLLYYRKHNSLTDRFLLRTYLILRFGFKYLISFKKINLNILLLSIGLKENP